MSPRKDRVWPRRIFVVTLVSAYAVAMGLLAAFTGLEPLHWPFLALNALVVVNVAYVFACGVTSAWPQTTHPEADLGEDPPDVAVLYCTYNDADPDAIAAACRQDLDCDVFLLDDSTDEEVRRAVDQAAATHGATVVRRDDRSGFKAGAINHWFEAHGDRYDHVVVLDADSTLPPEWVRRMTAKMEARPGIGMLHSRSASHREGTWFSRLLRGGIPVYMSSVARAESMVGPMLSWGHHVIVRTEAIAGIDGFVEARAEDLATSMQLMREGWDVDYAPDVVAYEKTPPNYQAVRKRNVRWGEGTLEALRFLSSDVPLSAQLSLYWRASAFLAGPGLLALFVLVMLGLPAPNPGLNAVWAGMIAAGMLLPLPSVLTTGRWREMTSYWVAAGLIALGSLVSSTYLLVKGLWDGADFVVTPKTGERIPLLDSVRTFGLEVAAGVAFLVLAAGLRAPIGVVWGLLLLSIPLFNTWTSVPLEEPTGGEVEAVPEAALEE